MLCKRLTGLPCKHKAVAHGPVWSLVVHLGEFLQDPLAAVQGQVHFIYPSMPHSIELANK